MRGFSAWKALEAFLWRHFSIGVLCKTLLYPIRRDQLKKDDLSVSFPQRIIWNLVSRLLGASIRLSIIAAGLFLMLWAIILLPFFVVLHLSVSKERMRKQTAIGRDLAFGWTPLLSRYARKLEKVAEVPLIGKDEQLRALERILGRGSQNNALVIGEPGSGRMTLVEQFAKRITWGETFPQLQYRHVYELPLEGMSEVTMRTLLSEAAKAGNSIIVIKNLHAIPEALDVLLPYLQVAGLQVIGLTDGQGYHQVLKTRSDVMKFFEKVELTEPNTEDVAALLTAVAAAHGTPLGEGAAEEIVRLTSRFMHDRPQPEKSLDILEELRVVHKEMISIKDVQALVSEKTNIPVGKIDERERTTLLELEPLLRQYIVGQSAAVTAVADVLRRVRSGLADKDRPAGSMLFFGPTGVGKTYTAQTLSRIYYGTEEILHFDMTEYALEHSLETFTDRLVIAMEERPFSLVLFDEIEKAHPTILNVFLQILEEAHLTNSVGRKAYLNSALLICTSNAGSELLIKNPALKKEELIEYMISANIFRPEFLNRFDGIVLFAPLSEAEALRIASLMLEKLAERVSQERQITLSYEPGLAEDLAQLARSSTFGARAVRHAIQDKVESWLAREFIAHDLPAGSAHRVPRAVVK